MRLYLSRLVLNSKMRMVQRDIGDCQAMHQRIMSAFASISSSSPRNDMGILYKMQSSPDENTIIAMVQSEQMPDWSILPKGYLMEQVANPAIKDITRLLDRLSSNQRYVFELPGLSVQKNRNKHKRG